MTKRHLLRSAAALATVILLAVGCSSDDDTSPPTSEEAPDGGSSAVSTTDDDTGTSAPSEGDDRSEELVGRWEVVNYALPDDGGLTNVVGDEPVFLEFSDDGELSYGTGCNTGGTEYSTSGGYYEPESPLDDTPEGQAITIGPSFEQTEIACEGFLGDQDADLPADLEEATRFTLDGDSLSLLDEFLLLEAERDD